MWIQKPILHSRRWAVWGSNLQPHFHAARHKRSAAQGAWHTWSNFLAGSLGCLEACVDSGPRTSKKSGAFNSLACLYTRPCFPCEQPLSPGIFCMGQGSNETLPILEPACIHIYCRQSQQPWRGQEGLKNPSDQEMDPNSTGICLKQGNVWTKCEDKPWQTDPTHTLDPASRAARACQVWQVKCRPWNPSPDSFTWFLTYKALRRSLNSAFCELEREKDVGGNKKFLTTTVTGLTLIHTRLSNVQAKKNARTGSFWRASKERDLSGSKDLLSTMVAGLMLTDTPPVCLSQKQNQGQYSPRWVSVLFNLNRPLQRLYLGAKFSQASAMTQSEKFNANRILEMEPFAAMCTQVLGRIAWDGFQMATMVMVPPWFRVKMERS